MAMKRFGIVSEVLLWAGIVCVIAVVMTIFSMPGKDSRWGFRGALTLAVLSIACFVGSQVSKTREKESEVAPTKTPPPVKDIAPVKTVEETPKATAPPGAVPPAEVAPPARSDP